MNAIIREFLNYIQTEAPKSNKETVKANCIEKFNLIQDRSVFHNDFFAVRFCYTKNGSFSNTVLSLSCLEKYDRIPFFVVLVQHDDSNKIYLANSSFLEKISHSSKNLTMRNIRGSFNGSDIIKKYNDLENIPDNFDELFPIHESIEWVENLERLVEATNNIKPSKQRYCPDESNKKNIINSITRANDFIASKNYDILYQDLNQRCNRCKNEILIASRIPNVNIRGRLIETLITCDEKERKKLLDDLVNLEKMHPVYDTRNGLGDYVKTFNNGKTLTDIKTKIVYLNSNPKAYNVDKFLQCMAENNTIFFFFFVGIDKESIFKTILCSVYHSRLIDCTILQHHWAGKSSRGVAQFNGKIISEMLQENDFKNDIEENKTLEFLQKLLNR